MNSIGNEVVSEELENSLERNDCFQKLSSIFWKSFVILMISMAINTWLWDIQNVQASVSSDIMNSLEALREDFFQKEEKFMLNFTEENSYVRNDFVRNDFVKNSQELPKLESQELKNW